MSHYRFVKTERRDGILQMTLHSDGGPLQWTMEAWTDRLVRQLVHAPGSPWLGRRIWPNTTPPSPLRTHLPIAM